jgi:hypothetical protein
VQVSKFAEAPSGPMGIIVGTFITALERCTFVPTAQYSSYMQRLRTQHADAAVHAATASTATSASSAAASRKGVSSSSSGSSTDNDSDSSSDKSSDSADSSSSSSSTSIDQDFTQPFRLQWHQDAYGHADISAVAQQEPNIINENPTDEYVQRQHSITTLAMTGRLFFLGGGASHLTTII